MPAMTAPKPRRRLLFIVSRERMDLYDALRNVLANEPGCEVIIDRREGEHGSGPGTRTVAPGIVASACRWTARSASAAGPW